MHFDANSEASIGGASMRTPPAALLTRLGVASVAVMDFDPVMNATIDQVILWTGADGRQGYEKDNVDNVE
jgi:hypothetical protein